MEMNLSRNQDEETVVVIKTRLEPEENNLLRKRLQKVISEIELPAVFTIILDKDQKNEVGRFYFQIEAERIDTFTGKTGFGRGGKAYLSEHMTNSELVQTVFGLYNSYLHHEARETFKWRGRRVYGPHIDVQAHWEIAERYDARTIKD